MKFIAKAICCSVALAWMQGATAGDVAVNVQADSIVLESVSAPSDAAALVPASAPAQAQSGQGVPSVDRVPVTPYRDKVDRTRIEKRISDRAARTKKRSLDAEKDAAGRASGAP